MLRAAGREVAVAGNVGHAALALEGECAGRVDRLRAVVLPAGGRSRAALARRRAAQPRDRPPRPSRHVGGATARRSCESSRSAATSPIVPRGFGRAGGGIEFSADDELPAEPRIPRRPQPGERCRRGSRRARGRDPRLGDRTGARDVPGRAAPARARARARRRALGQRLDRDERRRCARGARSVRRARAPDPRRFAEGRGLRRRSRARCRPHVRSVLAVGAAADELAAALDAAGGGTSGRRPRRGGRGRRRRRRAGRRRPALAGVRELRPVPELRGARRGVPPPRRENLDRRDERETQRRVRTAPVLSPSPSSPSGS